jgi:hypothetical protein
MDIIIIIIIIIVVINYPWYLPYAAYLHLYSRDKTYPKGTPCCSYSGVTIHGAHIASSCIDFFLSLR